MIKNKKPIKPNKKLYLSLAKKMMIDYVYNTSALEGNTMTYPEVATLLEGITVGGKKVSEHQMILNQNESIELLFEMIENDSFTLNKETMLKLHKKVAFREALEWGVFRTNNVLIGGTDYKPPHHTELEKLFQDDSNFLVSIDDDIQRAVSTFAIFAKRQFFYDGNKRTARLMMNGILLSTGYPMLNIKAKDKLEFNKQMINYYDTDDLKRFINYLVDYYYKQIETIIIE